MDAANINLQTTTQFPSEPAVTSGGGFQTHPNSAVEAGGSTIFTSDTIGNVAERSRLDDIDSSVWSSVSQPGAQDIKDFLAKPTLLASGSFNTTDSGNLNLLSIPESFYTNTRISNKLAGVAMARFDVIFTLEVNANRFQQGRYVMAFCPTGGLSTLSGGAAAFYRAHAANMTSVSQLPHVEIDLATQTIAELRIPYASIYPYTKVSAAGAINSLGYVFLRPYSALQGSPTTCGFMLFGRLENVVLSGNILPQSGRVGKFKMSKGKSVQGIEQTKTGPISGVLNTITMGTSILSKLPLIGSVLSQVSWASDVLAGAASAFGFSKPALLDKVIRMATVSFPYSGTADGHSPAMPLGLSYKNEVVVHSGIGRTDIDEMSIDFIKQQYAYYSSTIWTTANSSGSAIITLYHNPMQYFTSLGVNGIVQTPVCFVANQFRVWRGSLKYKFKIVKTEFHSGRLIFSYAPYTGISAVVPSIDLSTFLMREIVDLRDTSEVEFCVPYVIPDVYTQCGYSSGTPLVDSAGIFYVTVGDKLVAPAAATSSVIILVEVCAGPDFEVAIPTAYNSQAMIPFATQSGVLKDIEVLKPSLSSFQSSYVKHDCQQLGLDSTDLTISTIAIGEKAESMRQLIKRVQAFVPSGGTFPSGTVGQDLILNVHAVNPVVETVSIGGTLVPDTWVCDFMSTLSLCYVFNNGGVRFFVPKLFGSESSITSVTVDRDPSTTNISTMAYYFTYTPARSAPTQLFLFDESPVHVAAPSYSRQLGRASAAQIASASGTIAPNPTEAQGANTTTVIVHPVDSPSGGLAYRPYRYAGDDYSMSYWIGTVPVVGV